MDYRIKEPSLLTLDVSQLLGPDGANAVNDALRMVCIQVTIQALMFFNDPRCTTFFSADFILITMYIVLGTLIYWLVLRRLVAYE
jgi:hypothetical protein